MRPARPAAGLLLLAAAAAAKLPAATLVRTEVEPKIAWVGQRVLLKVDVLSDRGWAQVSRFGELEMAGAYLLGDSSQGVRLQRDIDGESYSGQRYELSVYPQVAGRLAIPPMAIEVRVRRLGAEGGDADEQRQTPVASLEVKTPPGAEGIRGLVSTPRLAVEQRWDGLPQQPKVGDAFKRVVRFEAEQVSGMAFTPLVFAAPAAVGLYPAEPAVQDRRERGSLTGTRTESVTYVLERPGTVSIPGLRYSWWDTAAERLETVELDGVELTVAGGASDLRGSPVAEPGGRPSPVLVAGLSLLGLLVAAAYGFRARLLGGWQAWREARRASEPQYFKRALASIRSGDAGAALADTMRWLDRIHSGPRPARLDPFLARFAQAGERRRLSVLLASEGPAARLADADKLAVDLCRVRARWRVDRAQRERRSAGLPALNG